MTNEELKSIRLAKGMTQQQFGEWVGYSKTGARQRIAEIEAGLRRVPASVELFLIKKMQDVVQ